MPTAGQAAPLAAAPLKWDATAVVRGTAPNNAAFVYGGFATVPPRRPASVAVGLDVGVLHTPGCLEPLNVLAESLQVRPSFFRSDRAWGRAGRLVRSPRTVAVLFTNPQSIAEGDKVTATQSAVDARYDAGLGPAGVMAIVSEDSGADSSPLLLPFPRTLTGFSSDRDGLARALYAVDPAHVLGGDTAWIVVNQQPSQFGGNVFSDASYGYVTRVATTDPGAHVPPPDTALVGTAVEGAFTVFTYLHAGVTGNDVPQAAAAAARFRRFRFEFWNPSGTLSGVSAAQVFNLFSAGEPWLSLREYDPGLSAADLGALIADRVEEMMLG